jgi:hypothetical protein
MKLCMFRTIAMCTVKISRWQTEELSETCRVSFQSKFEKLGHLVGYIVRNLSRCAVTWTSNVIWAKQVGVVEHPRLVYVRCTVWFLAGASVILTGVFHGLPQSIQACIWSVSQFSLDHFEIIFSFQLYHSLMIYSLTYWQGQCSNMFWS